MPEPTWNCKDVFDRLQDYLDRELTPEEMVRVDAHLSACGHCADEFAYEGSVLRHIKRCCADEKTPENLVASMFAKLDES